MQISRIQIHNYRSIKDIKLICGSVVIILGENNSGKSNILSALEFALSSSAKPQPEDLFAFRDENDDKLWVELTFEYLTDAEKQTFQKYLRTDQTIRIRKSAYWNDQGSVVVQYNGYIEEPQEEWLRVENVGNYRDRSAADTTPLAEFLPKGRLTNALIEEAQQAYIAANRNTLILNEQLETTPLLGLRNVAAGVLPDFYLVPAIRDLDDEAKMKSTTTFGRLLTRALDEMASKNARYVKVRTDLGSLVASFNKSADNDERPQELTDMEVGLQTELSEWGVEVSIRIEPPDISKLFELGTSLYVNDGLDTLAQRKGHGLQRAVVFGLIKSWAKATRHSANGDAEQTTQARRSSESILFAVEEPELFLHPQAQRSLAASLRQLGESHNHQVFLCSHSAHFVNLDNYPEILIASKDDARAGTRIRQCTQELFEGSELDDRKKRFHMAYWINPDRGEIFFAKKVVLVEGETEKTLLPYLAQKLGCYDPAVSIVDCGSKHNLPLYVTIGNAFKLNYHVVHDEDPLPNPIPVDWDENKKREKRRTHELNAEIASLVGTLGKISVCSDDIETLSGVSKTQGKNKGKALAALEHFQNLSNSDIPAELVELVVKVYTLDI